MESIPELISYLIESHGRMRDEFHKIEGEARIEFSNDINQELSDTSKLIIMCNDHAINLLRRMKRYNEKAENDKKGIMTVETEQLKDPESPITTVTKDMESMIAESEVKDFLESIKIIPEHITEIMKKYPVDVLLEKIRLTKKTVLEGKTDSPKTFFMIALQKNWTDADEKKELARKAQEIFEREQLKKRYVSIVNRLNLGEHITQEEYDLIPKAEQSQLFVAMKDNEPFYYIKQEWIR